MTRRFPQSALGIEMRSLLANNVRAIRRRKGMTQADLANASGLDRTFVNRLERGHVSVALETIGAIATALEIPPRELIEPAD